MGRAEQHGQISVVAVRVSPSREVPASPKSPAKTEGKQNQRPKSFEIRIRRSCPFYNGVQLIGSSAYKSYRLNQSCPACLLVWLVALMKIMIVLICRTLIQTCQGHNDEETQQPFDALTPATCHVLTLATCHALTLATCHALTRATY